MYQTSADTENPKMSVFENFTKIFKEINENKMNIYTIGPENGSNA